MSQIACVSWTYFHCHWAAQAIRLVGRLEHVGKTFFFSCCSNSRAVALVRYMGNLPPVLQVGGLIDIQLSLMAHMTQQAQHSNTMFAVTEVSAPEGKSNC